MFNVITVIVVLTTVTLSLNGAHFRTSVTMSGRHIAIKSAMSIVINVSGANEAPAAATHKCLPVNSTRRQFGVPVLTPKRSGRASIRFHAMSHTVLPVNPLHVHGKSPFNLIHRRGRLTSHVAMFVRPHAIHLSALGTNIPHSLRNRPSNRVISSSLSFCKLHRCRPNSSIHGIR